MARVVVSDRPYSMRDHEADLGVSPKFLDFAMTATNFPNVTAGSFCVEGEVKAMPPRHEVDHATPIAMSQRVRSKQEGSPS